MSSDGIFWYDADESDQPKPDPIQQVSDAFREVATVLGRAFGKTAESVGSLFCTPKYEPAPLYVSQRQFQMYQLDQIKGHESLFVFYDEWGAANEASGIDSHGNLVQASTDDSRRSRRAPATCPRHGEVMRGGFCRRCSR